MQQAHSWFGGGRERGLVARRVRSMLTGGQLADPIDLELHEADPDPDRTADEPVPARRGLSGRVRVDPGRRGAAAVGIAALVAALLTGWWVEQGRPHAQAVAAPVSATRAVATHASTAPSESTVSGSRSAAPALVVDVVGKVAHPGVVRLPAGARVEDALAAAGGALPGTDLTGVNLARKVVDGEQIAVGVPQTAVAVTGPGTGTASTATPLDLNSATLEQLDALPGVGPVLAGHILDWRVQHGRFDSVDQLREVSGIGPAKYASIKALVTV